MICTLDTMAQGDKCRCFQILIQKHASNGTIDFKHTENNDHKTNGQFALTNANT